MYTRKKRVLTALVVLGALALVAFAPVALQIIADDVQIEGDLYVLDNIYASADLVADGDIVAGGNLGGVNIVALGTMTASHVSADDIVVGCSTPIYDLTVGSGNDHRAISIYSGNDKYGSFVFSDGTTGDARYAGWLEYNHANDKLTLGAEAAEQVVIDVDGMTVNGDLTVGGNVIGDVTIEDDLSVWGSSTISGILEVDSHLLVAGSIAGSNGAFITGQSIFEDKVTVDDLDIDGEVVSNLYVSGNQTTVKNLDVLSGLDVQGDVAVYGELEALSYLVLPTAANAPPSADCDNDSEFGRMTLAGVPLKIYVCNFGGWDWAVLTD